MPRCPLSLVEFDNVADADKIRPILCTRRLLRLFVLRLSTLRHLAKRFADVTLKQCECHGLLQEQAFSYSAEVEVRVLCQYLHNLSVLISFLMVLPIIYASVLEGIRAADHQLLEMAKLFRVPPVRCIRYVYLPQVMPYFHSACGSALGLCWKAGIAAEVIGMPRGSIGECLQQAKVYLDTPDLFAWTLVIVVISLAFEKVFIAFMNACTVWLERI